MYKKRRQVLRDRLRENYPKVTNGVIVLFADFEDARREFLQESSFYYFTGCDEPGAVLCMALDGSELLFTPAYGRKREEWVSASGTPSINTKPLGKPCSSYFMQPFFSEDEHEDLIAYLQEQVGTLFTLLDRANDHYFFAINRFEKLFTSMGLLAEQVKDISFEVAALRRKKDEHEIALIENAIDITCQAHRRVAACLRPGMYEYEIQAEIERVFTSNHARIAFPSIVATGKNTTILHYMARDQKLQEGDMLVVDIGAQVGHYCADLTRTYCVGERLSRQQEIYDIVLELQAYIASLAKPGMFLANADQEALTSDRSLHHLALAFLEERGTTAHGGYKDYFVHGIGHFLGLDVHDVGDLKQPLAPGDVFTIEPGIYLPDEGIGVRIEDDYLITPSGCRCLSDGLVK